MENKGGSESIGCLSKIVFETRLRESDNDYNFHV